MERDDAKQRNELAAKRPYQAPQLRVYGSLTELTNNTMMGGGLDGAGKGSSGS